MSELITPNDIHASVREHYGAIARSAGTPDALSCCGPSTTNGAACCTPEPMLYEASLLEGLPASVSGLSLGCGDPVSIAALRPGERVLDLGSGGGIDCFLAAKQVGADGYVIGVDMTPDMLAKANANKASMGVGNVEFRQGQIEALPVESDSIDVIISNCVINLSPDKPAVFRDSFRVLKSGGRVSVSDIVTEGEFSAEQRARLDQWSACVTGAVDVSIYTGMMREAGFVNIQVADKNAADGLLTPMPMGMPRVFSARITAQKP